MSKSADGPPQGRMGFGYQQSRDAGVPYIRPSSNGEINLQAFVKRHPDLALEVRKLLLAGNASGAILHELREAGHDGHYAIDFWRDAEAEDWAEIEYSNDEQKLRARAASALHLGVYKRALLWRFDPETHEWSEVEVFQEQDAGA
jgi:hypothetical protein